MDTNQSDIPAGEQLPIDPEIEALLEFEPVPRKVKRKNGWFPHLQREFVHRLALTGCPGTAARQMRKNVSGIEAIYREEGADSFRAAWDAALELAWARERHKRGATFDGRAPGIKVRGAPSPDPDEWEEDDGEAARRHEEVLDSIRNKLLRARRLYLQEISGSPGKRAAFEILTELPVEWDMAAAGEPQPDEPWNRCNQREPDMILTAESGWSFGEIGYGPDRLAEARKVIDEHRAAQGLEPIDWDADDDEEGGVEE